MKLSDYSKKEQEILIKEGNLAQCPNPKIFYHGRGTQKGMYMTLLAKTIITVAILAGAIGLIYVYIKARLYVKAWKQWTVFFNDERDRMDK